MAFETVVVADSEHTARALLSVLPFLPAAAEAHVVQLGPLDRSALAALPARSAAHYPSLDPPGGAAEVIAAAVDPHVPAAGLVVLDSAQWSRDLAGGLADRFDAAVVWAIDRIAEEDGATAAHHVVLGGSHRLVHRIDPGGTTVVLAKPTGTLERVASTPPQVTTCDAPAARVRVRERSRTPHQQRGKMLSQADVVVCVGVGIGDAAHVELFERLAERIGAAVGATRAVVDRGWLPFACQVGQTGETVAPALYLGFGVSGAAQHLAGMRAAKRVVAINTDPDAPLCQLADIVVQADAVDVATRLLALAGDPIPTTSP